MGYYLIQIYIPSSLIVVISWVSFWLNRGATPARVTLGVTTVLTMITLMGSTNSALPKVSYVKSIDVYLGFCFFMVFASLLEYASVGYMAKRIQMRKNRFLALQKMAEQKKKEIMNAATNANNVGHDQGLPKQSVVHFKSHDQDMHVKGGSRENTLVRYHHAAANNGSKYGPGPPNPHPALQRGGPRSHSIGGGPGRVGGPVGVPIYGGPPDPDEASPMMIPLVPPPPQPLPPPMAPPPPHPLPPQPHPLPPPENPDCNVKDLNKMFGMTASDIDKYSRVMFPVTFASFQLMYWIIYQHLSDHVVDELVYLNPE